MLEILKVIILSIVEGITEWLPISSTGHLILLEDLINLKVSNDFKSMFLVVIQFGAILSIFLKYYKRLNPFDKKRDKRVRKEIYSLWFKIFIALLPAGLLGLFLDDFIDKNFYNGYVVASMLILYGVIFILIDSKKRKIRIDRLSKLDYQTALYLGFFQALALVPGTSRSGALIVGGILLGLSRLVAVEFSFFLGVPIIGLASLLKLIKFGFNYSFLEFIYLLIGLLVSFVFSYISVNYFLSYIKKHTFKNFGIYRIVLGIIVLIWYFVSSLPIT